MSAEELIDVLITPRQDLSWQEDGICASTDPDAFFPDMGGSPGAAKGVCARCPVTGVDGPCATYALDNFIRYGVWGGTTGKERVRLWHERGINPDEMEAAA